MKQILVSGVKPTGSPHIGNYFGAMKQFVDLQDKYDTRVFIADLHAITTINNPAELRKNIIDVAIDYLAIGIDPEKTKIFKQSDIPQIPELAWTFNCLVTVPYLMRAHAFKDAESKGNETNVGTFDYPVLMAADILIQETDIVPVGRDQKQHIEYARDIASKFNNTFGQGEEVFKLPKEMILESVEIIPGTDGQKMSKSYNNTIPLFASDEEIDKLVMSIVTDSGADIPANVYNIHKLFREQDSLRKLYNENRGKYKILKEALAEDIKNFIRPMRERRNELAQNPEKIISMLESNGQSVRDLVEQKMDKVRKLIGYKLN